MNYLIVYKDDSSQIITGTTIQDAIVYAQTTGKEFQYLTQFTNTVVVLDTPNKSFNVSAKNTNTHQLSQYLFFCTNVSQVLSWIDNVGNLEITHLGDAERTLV